MTPAVKKLTEKQRTWLKQGHCDSDRCALSVTGDCVCGCERCVFLKWYYEYEALRLALAPARKRGKPRAMNKGEGR